MAIAIVGRPWPTADRPDARASPSQCARIGANSPGSANNPSILAKSSGSSRASTGSTSSHNDSTCPASNRSTPTPKIADKPPHLQANHPDNAGQNQPGSAATISGGSD